MEFRVAPAISVAKAQARAGSPFRMASAAERVLARHRERFRAAVHDFEAASRAYARGDEDAFASAAARIVAAKREADVDERETLRGEDTPDGDARRLARERLVLGALHGWAIDVEARRPELSPAARREWLRLTESAVLVLSTSATGGTVPRRWRDACREAGLALARELGRAEMERIPKQVLGAVELSVVA